MSEQHLFILWEKARIKEQEVLEEIKNNFKILKIFEIKWDKDKFINNLSVLYGHDIFDVNFLESDRGYGEFLVVLVEDINPNYQTIQSLKGNEYVNVNIYNLKNNLRNKYFKGGFSIYATQTLKEAYHDCAVIFHKSLKDLLIDIKNKTIPSRLVQNTVSVAGWKSLEQIFYILNETCNYVVLRNFEHLPYEYKIDEHEDIDILVENVQEFCHLMQPINDLKENAIPLTCFVQVKDIVIPFHKKFILDGYYDKEFSKKIIEERALNSNGIYIPSIENQYYALAYHAYFHKEKISDTYKTTLKELGNILFNKNDFPNKKEILNWLKANNYKHSICIDCLLTDKKRLKHIMKFNPADEEFYYYSSGINGSLLFHKKMFSLNPKFLTMQLRNFCIFFDFQNHILPKDHFLVKKYLKRVKKGEYLWFFKARYGKIIETTYCEDKKQIAKIKRRFLLNDRCSSNKFINIIPDKTRLVYYGEVFQDKIKNISDQNELINLLDKFVLEVFTKYETRKNNLLKPEAFDALPFNCIVDSSDKYNFIDSEFQLKSGVEKSFFVWRLCQKEHSKFHKAIDREELFRTLCQRYQLVDLSGGYHRLQQAIHWNINATPIEIFYQDCNYNFNNPLNYKENYLKKYLWKQQNQIIILKIKLIKILTRILINKNAKKSLRNKLINMFVFKYQKLYENYFDLKNEQNIF